MVHAASVGSRSPTPLIDAGFVPGSRPGVSFPEAIQNEIFLNPGPFTVTNPLGSPKLTLEDWFALKSTFEKSSHLDPERWSSDLPSQTFPLHL
jgi:hypothetical protein